jgi:hypothetical protein
MIGGSLDHEKAVGRLVCEEVCPVIHTSNGIRSAISIWFCA